MLRVYKSERELEHLYILFVYIYIYITDFPFQDAFKVVGQVAYVTRQRSCLSCYDYMYIGNHFLLVDLMCGWWCSLNSYGVDRPRESVW